MVSGREDREREEGCLKRVMSVSGRECLFLILKRKATEHSWKICLKDTRKREFFVAKGGNLGPQVK